MFNNNIHVRVTVLVQSDLVKTLSLVSSLLQNILFLLLYIFLYQ